MYINVIKPTFDLIIGLLLFLITLPFIVVIAILLLFINKGKPFFIQNRPGKNDRIFKIIKFKTMNDGRDLAGNLLPDSERITKVGKFIRKTSLDELPQLLNVLYGQMSLVGPRPERPHFVKIHKALQGLRLAVKPGLTGLAQVNNFYDLHPKHKIKYDFLYIQRRSLLLNIYILLKTIIVVFLKKGW